MKFFVFVLAFSTFVKGQQQYTKLAYSTSGGSVFNVVDLLNPTLTCESPTNAPSTYGWSAETVDGVARVCGNGQCYDYDPVGRVWSMNVVEAPIITERGFASDVVMPGNVWWILGGNDTTNGDLLASTEYRDATAGLFLPGPNMPVGGVHYSGQLTDTAIFIFEELQTDFAYVFWTNGSYFQRTIPPEVAGSRRPVVGTARSNSADDFDGVIAGGDYGTWMYNVTWTYNLRADTWSFTWMPNPISAATMVSYGDSFLAVGGYGEGGVPSQEAREFVHADASWIPHATPGVEADCLAFLVADDFVACS